MRHLALFAALLLLCGVAVAQDGGGFEVYGGYQYTSFDLGDASVLAEEEGISIDDRLNANGWNAGVQYKFNDNFGIVFDASGAYAKTDVTFTPELIPVGIRPSIIAPPESITIQLKPQMLAFQVGPQFTYGGVDAPVRPFVRALLGIARARMDASLVGSDTSDITVGESDSGLGYDVGGGFDIRINDAFAVRVGADYLGARVFDETTHNLRVTTGLVVRFGK